MYCNDMHVHTISSPDADLPAEVLCALGRDTGLKRIGFVSHLDLHPDDFCHGGFDEGEYLSDLQKAEETQQIEILRGLEIGEPHRFLGEASAMFSSGKYDFITGALHWLGSSMILDERPFLEQNPVDLIRQYYEEILEMVLGGGFDILAHMGIFRRGMARAGLSCQLDETSLFPELLREVLTAVIKKGIAIEVNTAGLRRPEGTTYPAGRVLLLYRELGGRMVTIGSDTHRLENAFFGLPAGAKLLSECGFSEEGYFKGGTYFGCPLQCL